MLKILPIPTSMAGMLLATLSLAQSPYNLQPNPPQGQAIQTTGQGGPAQESPQFRETSTTKLAGPTIKDAFPTAKDEAVPNGQELLETASRRLLKQPSISCKIRQKIDLYGQQMVGVGSYLQLRPASDRLLRLELKLQVNEQSTSMTQVADGRFLWIRRELPGGTQLSRVDLRQIESAQPEKGDARSDPMSYWLVLGGLPKLLTGLQTNFQFGNPQATQLTDVPVWIVEGSWRLDRLVEMLPNQKEALQTGKEADLTDLPQHLPHRVVVVLGRDDLFPYRIEYRRNQEASEVLLNDKKGVPVTKTIVAMEMFEVQLGGAIDRSRFNYQPGDTDVVDQTGVFLQSLGLRTAEKPTHRKSLR